MYKFIFVFFLHIISEQLIAQNINQVKLVHNEIGYYLLIDEEKFIVNGMNWDYVPIGTNTLNAKFWEKSDEVIRAGLASEMSLLKAMNVNAIRQYTGVPPRWIKYIYENYGIYTMLNHSFGRYGLLLNEEWVATTDYSQLDVQHQLLKEIEELVAEYKSTPGLLMYLLGNENNYGLFWSGSETEDFPEQQYAQAVVGEQRARPMYALMNKASQLIKKLDKNHPVAICNGDLMFIDIIAEECRDVDIFGTNSYRGVSFGDMFEVVSQKLKMPVLLTEFGSDAFDELCQEEHQSKQAYYMVENWREIYENVAGLGKAENALGGFTFQFSDGWWKYGFDDRVNERIHDLNASWSNGGYDFDYKVGKNNMNEEWFGICAKGPSEANGLYQLYPRAAYFALKIAHELNPYSQNITVASIKDHFGRIQIYEALLKSEKFRNQLVVEK